MVTREERIEAALRSSAKYIPGCRSIGGGMYINCRNRTSNKVSWCTMCALNDEIETVLDAPAPVTPLASTRTELEAERKRHAETWQRANDMAAELERVTRERDDLRAGRTNDDRDYQRVTAELDRVRAEREQYLRGMNLNLADIERLALDLSECNADLSAARSEIANLGEQIGKLHEEVKRAQADAAAMHEAFEAVGAMARTLISENRKPTQEEFNSVAEKINNAFRDNAGRAVIAEQESLLARNSDEAHVELVAVYEAFRRIMKNPPLEGHTAEQARDGNLLGLCLCRWCEAHRALAKVEARRGGSK